MRPLRARILGRSFAHGRGTDIVHDRIGDHSRNALSGSAGFRGSVTPALLRDPANPYNTYRHAGLPPGPIANPGEASIAAVLAPAQSDFLYFVAKGQGTGRHTFSRTFAEHREALESPH